VRRRVLFFLIQETVWLWDEPELVVSDNGVMFVVVRPTILGESRKVRRSSSETHSNHINAAQAQHSKEKVVLRSCNI
jgi:hypothetical protein